MLRSNKLKKVLISYNNFRKNPLKKLATKLSKVHTVQPKQGSLFTTAKLLDVQKIRNLIMAKYDYLPDSQEASKIVRFFSFKKGDSYENFPGLNSSL